MARANLVHAHHGRARRRRRRGRRSPLREPDVHGRRPAPASTHGRLLAAAEAGLARRTESGTPHRLEVNVGLPSGATSRAEPVATLLEAPPSGLAVAVDVEERRAADHALLDRRGGRRAARSAAPSPPPTRSAAARRGNLPANALAVLERGTLEPDGTIAWSAVGRGRRSREPGGGGGRRRPACRSTWRAATRPRPSRSSRAARCCPLDHAADGGPMTRSSSGRWRSGSGRARGRS